MTGRSRDLRDLTNHKVIPMMTMIDFTVNLISFFTLGWIETLWNFEKFLILRYFYKSSEIQIERRMILIRLIIRLIINLGLKLLDRKRKDKYFLSISRNRSSNFEFVSESRWWIIPDNWMVTIIFSRT